MVETVESDILELPMKRYVIGRDFIGGNQVFNLTLNLELEQAESLDHAGVIAVARRIAEVSGGRLTDKQAARELTSAVAIAREIQRGPRKSYPGQPPYVTRALERFPRLVKAGKFDEAVADVDGALKNLDDASGLSSNVRSQARVALLEAAISGDQLRRDTFATAKRVKALVAEQEGVAGPWRAALKRAQAEWCERGENDCEVFCLGVSVELSRVYLSTATTAEERWDAANLLGNALLRLGNCEPGTKNFEAALIAFKRAAAERPRALAPLDWARSQSNLGRAFEALGEREAGTKCFAKAIESYESALEERRRDVAPLDWAKTQQNLGSVLRSFGARTGKSEYLQRAAAALRAVLEVYDQAVNAHQWAAVQSNLALTLTELGETSAEDAEYLEEAVDRFTEVLMVRSRDETPQQWAQSQNGYATALRLLGERRQNKQQLEDAAKAYEDIQKVWVREFDPLRWAGVWLNIGRSNRCIGELEAERCAQDGLHNFQTAVDAFRLALSESTRDRDPSTWATLQNCLSQTLLDIGRRLGDRDLLRRALDAADLALEVWTDPQHPCVPVIARRRKEIMALLRARGGVPGLSRDRTSK